MVDILEEMEIYKMDPEAYVLIMGGTPEELYPDVIKKLDTWLNHVYSK